MAKVLSDKIILNNDEKLLLDGIDEVEIIPNQKGIFLLIEKDVALEKEGVQVCVNMPLLVEQKEVIKLIKNKKLSELVEGTFETTLNEKQKTALLELITNGKVILFKLNETYKKGVYKINEAFEITKKEIKEKTIKDSENFNAEKKMLPDYTLNNDGFIATTNSERARILSSEYKEQIEGKELCGIKSFSGIYYLIETKLLNKHKEKILLIFEKTNKLNLEEIAKKENISLELATIICEFLKEDGELIEKKKGLFQYIS